MTTKMCSDCKEELPLEKFGKNSRRPDGLNYYCKPCTNARVRDYKKRIRSENPLHAIWSGMIARCTNPHSKDYARYGGRGIKVCQEWQESYEAFSWYLPPRPSGASLDRIDNNGHYEPGNVRWATPKEQSANRRDNKWITFQGRTLTMSQWAEDLNIHPATLKGRLRRMPVERALTEPVHHKISWTFEGRTMTPTQWSSETGIKRRTLVARVEEMGWPVSRALTTPPRS